MRFDSRIRLPGAIIATVKVLSSKALLIWLALGWVTYYVLLSIWGKESFAHFVIALEKNPVVQIPFLLFLVSMTMNTIRASRERIQEGRFRLLLWCIFPIGILVFMIGFFVSVTTRQLQWVIVGESHDFAPRWKSEGYRVFSINSGLKDSFLDIDLATGGGILTYEPKVFLSDMFSQMHEMGAFPPVKVDDTYFHILNFGLAPGIRLSENGTVRDEGYMPLRILTPGVSDTFEISPYPYRFVIAMEPEKIIQKGNFKASQYSTRNPSYRVKVYKGAKIVADRDSRDGIRFDGLVLSFFEPTVWVQIEMVKDPGVLLILAGLLLTVMGIPLSAAGLISCALRKHAQSKAVVMAA